VSGYYNCGTLNIGSSTLTNAGKNDLFLAKYDANGNVLWAKSAGGKKDDEGNSITIDVSGNIYLAGWFSSPEINFGSAVLINVGSDDIFLAKYDSNGNVLWAKSVGGTFSDGAYSAAVDASGNVYIAGVFNSIILNFGSTKLVNAGSDDIFLAKYDATGNVLWAKSVGGTGDDKANSIVVDASGSIYITGYFYSPTINLGSFVLTNAGLSDLFLAKYDTHGNSLWAKSVGGINRDFSHSVTVDLLGNIYVAGEFESPTISFDSNLLTNTGRFDIFLAKLSSNRNK
jgi:hypothetical protein